MSHKTFKLWKQQCDVTGGGEDRARLAGIPDGRKIEVAGAGEEGCYALWDLVLAWCLISETAKQEKHGMTEISRARHKWCSQVKQSCYNVTTGLVSLFFFFNIVSLYQMGLFSALFHYNIKLIIFRNFIPIAMLFLIWKYNSKQSQHIIRYPWMCLEV